MSDATSIRGIKVNGVIDRPSVAEQAVLSTSWLLESGCTEAVMESTGSYWKPVLSILEGSLKIILANPEQVKALRGKKTDPNDSRWLASLLRHGWVYVRWDHRNQRMTSDAR